MAEQALARKYRPEDFSEFIGSESIIRAIRGNLEVTHVYLFYGMYGCGKTTMARLVGKALDIDEWDTFEHDAATNRGINEIRTLKANVGLKPMKGDKKIYIIDEAHALTGDARDALLKVLEEPPDHVYFALCTTEIQKVSKTIRSRAKAGEYELKPLHRRKVWELLDWVIGAEELDIDSEVKSALVDCCGGIPRDTIGMLDKIKCMEVKEAIVLIESGSMEDTNVLHLCRLLLEAGKTGENVWPKARVILKTIEGDAEKVRRAVCAYMTKVMLDIDKPKVSFTIGEEFEGNYYD